MSSFLHYTTQYNNIMQYKILYYIILLYYYIIVYMWSTPNTHSVWTVLYKKVWETGVVFGVVGCIVVFCVVYSLLCCVTVLYQCLIFRFFGLLICFDYHISKYLCKSYVNICKKEYRFYVNKQKSTEIHKTRKYRFYGEI